MYRWPCFPFSEIVLPETGFMLPFPPSAMLIPKWATLSSPLVSTTAFITSSPLEISTILSAGLMPCVAAPRVSGARPPQSQVQNAPRSSPSGRQIRTRAPCEIDPQIGCPRLAQETQGSRLTINPPPCSTRNNRFSMSPFQAVPGCVMAPYHRAVSISNC